MADPAGKQPSTSMNKITSLLNDLRNISIDVRGKAWEISPSPPTQAGEGVEENPVVASEQIIESLNESLDVLHQAHDALNEFV